MTQKLPLKTLEEKANTIREDIIRMLEHAGSGHSAGPLDLADIFTALYFEVLKNDPKNPDWPDRDILLLSNGHCVPVRYATMAEAGYFDKKELMTLRQLGSRLQGHPERLKLPGMETTSGPLGCGLSQACGMALAMRMDKVKERWVYVVMGDGEQDEGNVWEAAMLASKYKLSNITAITDRNNIQIDGPTESVMPLEDFKAKWEAFGWHVLEIDGNNIEAVIDACAMAKAIVEKPVMIVAHTVPGKGVDFMEYDFHWHGNPPNAEQAKVALHELRTLGGKIGASMNNMHLVPDIMAKDIVGEPIRAGFGRGLKKAGELDERVVAACADLTDSTKMNLFAEAFPERFIGIGIGEQNLVTVGSGLAAMGKIPFVSSYAAFSPGRNWEQIRTTICLNDRPVKIVGSHAGVSVGPDGATHQMLEDLAITRVLPNMVVLAPSDSVEAEKATLAMAKDTRPNYMRLAREATPIITTADTPFEIGKAYTFASGEDVTLIATGTMTYQALVAAERLFKDGIDAEVLHVPTLKPLDTETILKSVRKTKCVVTAEEGQIIGGLGGAIAELLGEEFPAPIKRIGMQDRFGESGEPNQLLEHFGLTAKHLQLAAHHVVDRKKG